MRFVFFVLFVAFDAFPKPIPSTLVGVKQKPLACRTALTTWRSQLNNLNQIRLSRSVFRRLKLMSFNVDRLSIEGAKGRYRFENGFYQDYRNNLRDPRNEAELQILKRIIIDESPHIIQFSEISDVSSFFEFLNNESFLNGRYEGYMFPSNQKNSSLGFAVMKGLPIDIEFETHKNAMMEWEKKVVPLFVRDVPTLILSHQGKAPLVIMGIHAKSKHPHFDPEVAKRDPESFQRRSKEFEGIVALTEHYKKTLSNDTQFVLMGDFNTETSFAKEMALINKHFDSVFDIIGISPDSPSRITHSYFERMSNGTYRPKYSQLDDIFVTSNLTTKIRSAQVWRYRNEAGLTRPLPGNFEERDLNFSDHFPVIAEVDLFNYFFKR